MMDEVKHEFDCVNRKIENIEHTEIKELRQELQEVKLDLTKNNVLTEKLESTLTTISSAMESLKDSMIQLSKSNEEVTINLKRTNEKIDEIKKKQSQSDEDFENIKEQINAYDDKSKFDIMLYVKNNFVNIVAWAGIIGWVFYNTR